MKSKGITIWELHVEKIVLGLAFLAFAYFTVTQFIGNPNAATIDGKTVPPGEIDQLLEAKATEISAKLSPEAPSNLPVPDVDPIAEQLQAALEAPIAPVDTLNMLTYNTVPRIAGHDVIGQVIYNVPTLPVPGPTYARQFSDALTEDVMATYSEELAPKFEPGKPYDLTYVTYFAELDVAFARQQLQKFDKEHAQIPSIWYGGRPLWADLVIEREELTESGWKNRVVLDPLPSQISFRKFMTEGKLSVNDRNYMVDELLKPEVQASVVQPEFLGTRRGSWEAMSVGEIGEEEVIHDGANETELELARMDRIIRRTQQEIDRINTLLATMGGPLAETDPDPAGGESSGGGRGGSGGSTPGGGAGKGSGSGNFSAGGVAGASDERTRKQRIALTRKLKQFEERLTRLQEERAEMGGAVLVEETVDDGPKDKIMVWGHDINVEPGKVYRYRMKIQLLNPFFARRMNLKPEQQHLADQVTLESEASEWSAPMKVNPSVRVFLTSASAASQQREGLGGGAGSASFSVFKFYDGLMWQQEFVVQPGDRIGDVRSVTLRGPGGVQKKVDIDFRTDWLVVDVIESHEATATTYGGNRGLQAKAVLLNLKTGQIEEVRNPNVDRANPMLDELRIQVEISESTALSET